MFTCAIGAILTTIDIFLNPSQSGFAIHISIWIWFTVLFANFAESLAESRGKSEALSLRKTMQDLGTKTLEKDSIIRVEAGQMIPADGEVIEGIASVNESAITGESAPVIREAGGDRNSVMAGTKVLSDYLVIKITSDKGESFLDHIIKLVEGANRKKTPNEIALTILLTSLTILFLAVVISLKVFGLYSGTAISITLLVSLFVCLIPTTIGSLLSAIGIAGMGRMIEANVIATSGKAIEAAGDVDVLLLDKTGTITLGNRQAIAFIPDEKALAWASQLASFADETPEGRSIVILAKEKYGLKPKDLISKGAIFIPFSAKTKMSGVDIEGKKYRKGSCSAIEKFVQSEEGIFPLEYKLHVEKISKEGGTPLVVACGPKVLGVIHLKDIVKGGIRERFSQMRQMGIKTIMITGDNPMTASMVAAEAGVDDFLAEASPEDKLSLILEEQKKGHLVAMTGDGTNDAPALAAADVAVAMNTGTTAAKEAGNLIDLDSNPTKLIEIIKIGKQMLVTRGALTTFSIANDVAKYFAILPALFMAEFPAMEKLNIMNLRTSQSAVLSAVIFNALIILSLIPLALKGVQLISKSMIALLRRNLLIYGLGGIVAPFIGIKIIDMILGMIL